MSKPVRGQVLDLLASRDGQTDRAIADQLFGQNVHPSQVNQTCRALAASGYLVRRPGPEGLICNYLGKAPPNPVLRPFSFGTGSAETMSEDDVKRHVAQWLEADGWSARVAWGKGRGIDILAERGAERWIIEAKGCGSLQPMRVNYFIAMLGEILQRMDDPQARYSIAMPDLAQFRGLWNRLPRLAKERTQICALFVNGDGKVDIG